MIYNNISLCVKNLNNCFFFKLNNVHSEIRIKIYNTPMQFKLTVLHNWIKYPKRLIFLFFMYLFNKLESQQLATRCIS